MTIPVGQPGDRFGTDRCGRCLVWKVPGLEGVGSGRCRCVREVPANAGWTGHPGVDFCAIGLVSDWVGIRHRHRQTLPSEGDAGKARLRSAGDGRRFNGSPNTNGAGHFWCRMASETVRWNGTIGPADSPPRRTRSTGDRRQGCGRSSLNAELPDALNPSWLGDPTDCGP